MKIIDEKTKIRALIFERSVLEISDPPDPGLPVTGPPGITSIEAYEENGDQAPVVWFDLIHHDGTFSKINGRVVNQILYVNEKLKLINPGLN